MSEESLFWDVRNLSIRFKSAAFEGGFFDALFHIEDKSRSINRVPDGIRDSFKIGLDSQYFEGYAIAPMQLTSIFERNQDFKAVYQPGFLDYVPPTYGNARLLFSPRSAFSETSITGDNVKIVFSQLLSPRGLTEYPNLIFNAV